jgi:hypothetical protein
VEVILEGIVPNDDFYIGQSWETLLEYHKYLENPPKLIYFQTDDLIVDQSSNQKYFNNLQSISQLTKSLNLIDDLNFSDAWILIYGQKVEIPKRISVSILDHQFSPLPLITLLNEEIHNEAKKNLFKAVIVDLVGKVKLEKRFEKIIEEFPLVLTNFMLGYQSFISNYSFDKVRREYEEKRTEFILKINNAFQDVASKLIILPAPLWLALTQAKKIHDDTGHLIYLDLFKNITIVIIIVLVSIYLFLSINGQFHYLESVKKEYSQLFKRLHSDYPSVNLSDNPGQSELGDLNKRHDWIWWQLTGVNVLNVVMAILAIIILCQTF